MIFAVSIITILAVIGKQEAQLFANQFYSPFFDAFFFYSTKIVEWFSLIVLFIILLFKGAKYAFNGILIYGSTALITFTLKRLFFDHEHRPTFNNDLFRLIPSEFGLNQLTNNSFPSGHTTAAFTLFCFVAIVVHRKSWGVLFGIVAVVIGYSRVYLSQHWFQDLLAGASIGTFFTFVFYYLFDKINYGKWALKPLVKIKK